MFKRAAILSMIACLLTSTVWAAPRKVHYDEDGIGPALGTVSTITIAAPGVGKRNCITDLRASTLTTSAQYTINLISNGTTNYTVAVSTGQVAPALQWPMEDPWCADVNRTLQISIADNAGAPVAFPKINYQGYIRTH